MKICAWHLVSFSYVCLASWTSFFSTVLVLTMTLSGIRSETKYAMRYSSQILGMPCVPTLRLVSVQHQQCANRQCLNDVMLVRMEECISRNRPIIVGIISLQFHQYSRKAEDFQHPCTITTKGSTPISSRCVVPPIRKLWPVTECSPERAHTLLHRSMNQVRGMGIGFPASSSKANSAAVFGMLLLIRR